MVGGQPGQPGRVLRIGPRRPTAGTGHLGDAAGMGLGEPGGVRAGRGSLLPAFGA